MDAEPAGQLAPGELFAYRAVEEGFDPAPLGDTLCQTRQGVFATGDADGIVEYRQFCERLLAIPRTAVVPVRELMTADNQGKRIVALRFDVDLDPLTALRLARHNARIGLASSFYLLHNAYYYGQIRQGVLARNPSLAHWVLCLLVAGAEIGLHVDAIGLIVHAQTDGLTAVETELAWLRSQGAIVDGTVAHNSGPAYGAENFEIFRGNVMADPDAVPGRKALPLGRLDPQRLGLAYEANFPLPVPSAPAQECAAWLARSIPDAVRNESWMRTYLLDNPHFRRRFDAVLWHHGGGSWTFGHRSPSGQTLWRWRVPMEEAVEALSSLPDGARCQTILHPIYFSADALPLEKDSAANFA